MQEVILDISVKTDADDLPKIHIKQGDSNRYFQAVILDNGKNYSIPPGTELTVWFCGTGGRGNYASVEDSSAISVSGNRVTVRVHPMMAAVKGGGVMCLVMTDSNGEQLGLWDIRFAVEGLPGVEGIDAEDSYEAYRDLLSQAVQAAATFQTDPTLRVADMAADAKAVGEAIAALLRPGKKELFFSQTNDSGSPSTGGISEYPTKAGVYRVTDKYAAMGLPDGYGCLLIFNCGGYWLHIFVRDNAGVWYDVVSSATAPTEWKKLAFDSEVKANTAKLMESADYPGCYYRMVDGVKEWLNPPCTVGVRYRTTERYQGDVVYTCIVDCPDVTNDMSVSIAGMNPVIRYAATSVSTGRTLPYGTPSMDSDVRCFIGDNLIKFRCGSTYDGIDVRVQIWYV